MKASRITLLLVCHFVVFLLTSGCHREKGHADADEHSAAKPEEAGVTFKAGKGLHVPPETARFVGLRVEDVTERKVASTLGFTAQVYRAADETRAAALASGVVRPSEATALRAGLAVTAKTTDGHSFTARVAEINAGADGTNGSVEVLLEVNDEKAQLPHGSFVSVRIATGSDKAVVSVPRSALLRTAEGNFVYTVSGERFVRAAVKLGVVNHEFAEVTDGLYAGDQIVVQPVMTLWMAELQSIRGGQACADGH